MASLRANASANISVTHTNPLLNRSSRSETGREERERENPRLLTGATVMSHSTDNRVFTVTRLSSNSVYMCRWKEMIKR